MWKKRKGAEAIIEMLLYLKICQKSGNILSSYKEEFDPIGLFAFNAWVDPMPHARHEHDCRCSQTLHRESEQTLHGDCSFHRNWKYIIDIILFISRCISISKIDLFPYSLPRIVQSHFHILGPTTAAAREYVNDVCPSILRNKVIYKNPFQLYDNCHKNMKSGITIYSATMTGAFVYHYERHHQLYKTMTRDVTFCIRPWQKTSPFV